MCNGPFNFFFSNKRTIDKLRYRITQAISEQLSNAAATTEANAGPTITTSQIRVWFTDEPSITKLRNQLEKS